MRDRRDEEAMRQQREREWSNSRPNTFLLGPIDPRSVYPSYPFGTFHGDREDDE
jgi:hypothetical protein